MANHSLPEPGLEAGEQQSDISEEIRIGAELSRQWNEQDRDLAEQERQKHEDSRIRGEEYRTWAEAARVAAEELRQAHEQLRAVGEEARKSAEEVRQAAEELRHATEISLKATYDQAAILQELRETMMRYEAERTSSASRHLPNEP